MRCFSYIRFSSPEQAKGRSKERQLEAARNFAKEKGWELDESLCMYDPAMSGFHREHISKGELGVFLEAVKAGKIPTPCTLLVENLDRLSRDKIPDALTQFLDIIKAGISIATLMDKQIYTTDSISKDMTQLLISISIMSRAHEESRVKQIRRADNWQKGREQARNGKKIPARCAAWLKFNDDKTEFIPIPERVAVVERIYRLYIEGHGYAKICRVLNGEEVPTFQKNTNGWGTTTIRRILTTRTVLGEMQFMKTVTVEGGKRITDPDGQPVLDYYPQVIDDTTFYEARKRLKLRSHAYGRIGKMNNLFSGLTKCGYCGETMQYGIRGRKKHKYLTCAGAEKGTCAFMSFRYQDFENAFLLHCNRLKLADVISDDSSEQEKHVARLRTELVAVNGMLEESKQRIGNFTEAIGAGGSGDTMQHLVGLIDHEKAEQRKHTDRKAELLNKISELENLHHETATSLETIQETVDQMADAVGDERETIRRRLQKEIRALVKQVDMWPHGQHYHRFKKLLERGGQHDEVRAQYEWETGKNAKEQRTCTVVFRGGGTLSFRHKEWDTLQLAVETDEDGQITPRTYTHLRDTYKETMLKKLTEIDKRMPENQ